MMREPMPIKIEDVQPGDVVRQIIKPGTVSDPTVIAVEVRAAEPVLLPYGRNNSDTYLLSRPLPTVPYTVVAPPDKVRSTHSPYVLEHDGDKLTWFRRGTACPDETVMDALASGWTIIEMKGTDDE